MKHLAQLSLLLALALLPACQNSSSSGGDDDGCTCGDQTCTAIETCSLVVAAMECRWNACDNDTSCTPIAPSELSSDGALDQYCTGWFSMSECSEAMCPGEDQIHQCSLAIAEVPCDLDDLLWEWPSACVNLFEEWGCTSLP